MSEHEEPFRWRRWLWWGLAILVLLLFTGHAIWTSVAASQMSRKIEALKRAGEPILPMDFTVANVNAPDNAGPDILAAANLINSKAPEWEDYHKLQLAFPLRDDERRVLVATSEVIAPALKRLEQARGKTRFEWDIDFTQPMVGLPVIGFNEVRQLANALAAQAILDHDRRLDRAALDRLEQILIVSRLPDRHPILIGHLVSIGIDTLATSCILKIAPDLGIGNGPDDASPQNVRRMIDRLMDDDLATQGFILSLRGERMLEVDMIHSVVNGVPAAAGMGLPGANWPAAARYLIKPVYYRTGGQMIDNMNAILLAANEKSWPAAKAKLPVLVRTGSPLNQISELLIPSLNRAMENHYRVLTERHFAAIALAARWYAADHNGQMPPTLQDLVPAYLPAVPVDRLNVDLKPLGYKSTPDAPIVYSVGTNGKDDGGSVASSNPNPRRTALPASDWEMLDRVEPLDRPVRPAPTTDESGN